jgi:hypothetical protein
MYKRYFGIIVVRTNLDYTSQPPLTIINARNKLPWLYIHNTASSLVLPNIPDTSPDTYPTCTSVADRGTNQWKLCVPGINFERLNHSSYSLLTCVNLEVFIKKNTIFLMLTIHQLYRSCGVKIWWSSSRWRLALAANLLTVPLIPSHALLPCDVAKKFHSASKS